MALTQKDLQAIKGLIEVTIDERTKNLVTKADISHLPTKDEFYERMDKIMGELKTIRESQDILTHKVYRDHDPRIEKIEKKLHFPRDENLTLFFYQ